jgi:hypothetical protein
MIIHGGLKGKRKNVVMAYPEYYSRNLVERAILIQVHSLYSVELFHVSES